METMESLKKIADRYRRGEGSLVAVLQDINRLYGYLPEDVLRDMAKQIDVPISLFYSLATFYTSFRLDPIGKKHESAGIIQVNGVLVLGSHPARIADTGGFHQLILDLKFIALGGIHSSTDSNYGKF